MASSCQTPERLVELLFDADATLNLRSPGVLAALVPTNIRLIWTSYVFENELSALQRELELLRDSGRAHVEAVLVRSAAHDACKAMRRDGVDRGEAESIAWSRNTPAPSSATGCPGLDSTGRCLAQPRAHLVPA